MVDNYGSLYSTEFLETITQPVQYDESLQVLMVYLSNYQLIPLARTSELIGTLTLGRKLAKELF